MALDISLETNHFTVESGITYEVVLVERVLSFDEGKSSSASTWAVVCALFSPQMCVHVRACVCVGC